MKIKSLIISLTIFLTIIITIFICNQNSQPVLQNKHAYKKGNTSTLSMMLETEANSGLYEESKETSWSKEGYVFNETLSKCENGSELSWDDTSKAIIMKGNVSDKCYVYFDKKPDIVLLTDYIKSLYTIDGENGLYLHDADLANGAGDNSYRYTGANPNNYVCFGSNAETCPEDNLYRIIGVFNENVIGTEGNATGTKEERVKLVKKTSIGSVKWDDNDSNSWSTVTMNTVTLNGTYLTGLGEYANKIATTRWQVGGIQRNGINNQASVVYGYKKETTSNNIYDAKIGLMYINEYGFAASPANWTTTLNSYNNDTNKNNNWMFLGAKEWTISCCNDYEYYAFAVDSVGDVYGSTVDYEYAVRPTFSFEASIIYAGGAGTETDPIRIF